MPHSLAQSIQKAVRQWIDINGWNHPFAVTLTLKQRIGGDGGVSAASESLTPEIASRNLRHWLNVMNKQVYGSTERFLSHGDEVLAEFVEVQSGKNDERVELWKAINHAKRNDAKLLIAKLDRFSRKVSFIASIMEQGIGLVVAEMPNATDFQLHIFAALAQEERRLISERTRNALAEAKKRGVQLGKNGKVLAERNRQAADERAEALRPIIMSMVEHGTSLAEISNQLNLLGLSSARGGRFHTQQVVNLLKRLK